MDILKEANKIVMEVEEHMDIASMIENRENKDNGKRYSLEDVRRKIDENRNNQK